MNKVFKTSNLFDTKLHLLQITEVIRGARVKKCHALLSVFKHACAVFDPTIKAKFPNIFKP